MVGDLPTADAKPPPDMIFVCKLNPVTTEEVRFDTSFYTVYQVEVWVPTPDTRLSQNKAKLCL